MQKTSPVLRKEVYQVIVTIVNSKFFTARAAQKSLTPLVGIVVIVRAGAVERGGWDPPPSGLAACGAPAAQQRCQDGERPAVPLLRRRLPARALDFHHAPLV